MGKEDSVLKEGEGFIIQESTSHPGRFYRFNKTTQESEWVVNHPTNGVSTSTENAKNHLPQLEPTDAGSKYMIPTKCLIGNQASAQPRASSQRPVPPLASEKLQRKRRPRSAEANSMYVYFGQAGLNHKVYCAGLYSQSRAPDILYK